MSVFCDLDLSKRLERAEGRSGAAFTEARAGAHPELGAGWVEIGGVYAMYDGVDSPATQTFGLGLFEPVTDKIMDDLESFFRQRKAPVFHEVSPCADPSALSALNRRNYRPFEFTNVLVLPLDSGGPPSPPSVSVRIAKAEEAELWAQTAARGWTESRELDDFLVGMMAVIAKWENCTNLFAEIEGRPVATAAVTMHCQVALLAGASTIPEARQQGAQQALLNYRIKLAAQSGCDLAMMAALPGSGSQRNAERHGFRVAYTRTKWKLE